MKPEITGTGGTDKEEGFGPKNGYYHSLFSVLLQLCGLLRCFQSASLSQRWTRLKNFLMRALASALTADAETRVRKKSVVHSVYYF